MQPLHKIAGAANFHGQRVDILVVVLAVPNVPTVPHVLLGLAGLCSSSKFLAHCSTACLRGVSRHLSLA